MPAKTGLLCPRVVAEGFNPPVTGINYRNGLVYVSHRGFITTVDSNGNKEDLFAGLPSWGDHRNNRVVFGPDGMMYFGQGTATNSGVVGLDNNWVNQYPFFHDHPGQTIVLAGNNYVSPNPLPGVGHRVSTVDPATGRVATFAINKSGLPASATDGGGFERPIDAVFGPDHARGAR